MPGFNGTGPMGMGPMTGGGRGFCNPYGRAYAGYGAYPMAGGYYPNAGMMGGGYAYPRAGFGTAPYGMGMGRGFGMGMGMGRGFFGRGGGRGRGRW